MNTKVPHPAVVEIKELFLKSDEIQRLRDAFHQDVTIRMHISSSRRYTRFEFPYVAKLVEDVEAVLKKHNLSTVGIPYYAEGHVFRPTVEIAIPTIQWDEFVNKEVE